MDKESFNIFMERYKRNPFIVIAFYYIVPKLFYNKQDHKEEEKNTEEKKIESGIAALMAKHKAEVKDMDSVKEDSFMDYITNLLSKTEQSFSEVDKLRYTQIINISESLVRIKKRDDAKKGQGETAPIETVTTKLGGKD